MDISYITSNYELISNNINESYDVVNRIISSLKNNKNSDFQLEATFEVTD